MTRRELPPHLRSIGKHDWLDLILRLDIPTNRKTVAFALARFASTTDGTRVFPGRQKVADMANLHESNARDHIKALVGLGLLHLVKRGGGRAGAPNEYQLTYPYKGDGLPVWLDPDFEPYPGDSIQPGAAAVEQRPAAGGETETEHRPPAGGKSVDEVVDNSETATGGGHSSNGFHSPPPVGENGFHRPIGPETPTAGVLNTDRWRPPNSSRTPLTHQHPAGLRKVTNSLDETITNAEQAESITDDDYATAREILAAVDPELIADILAAAAAQLSAAGDRDPSTRAIVVLAADLATRPPALREPGPS